MVNGVFQYFHCGGIEIDASGLLRFNGQVLVKLEHEFIALGIGLVASN